MPAPRIFTIVIFGMLTLLGAPLATLADNHSDARRLRESGQIVPLKQILRGLEGGQGGRILEAELKRRGGGYRYEVEVLNRRGEVWELEFDAQNGRLLRRRQER